MSEFKQFLKDGELGPIRVGMGADELMDALGPPDGPAIGKNPRILRYGALEIVLTRVPNEVERVQAMGLYFQPVQEPIPEAIRPKDWQPSLETTEEEFRAYLARVGIPLHSRVTGENNCHLILESGARATFSHSQLHAVQFTLNSPGKHRLAVTLPDETFNVLRAAARDENRSVGELCAEWLNERAAFLEKQRREVQNAG